LESEPVGTLTRGKANGMVVGALTRAWRRPMCAVDGLAVELLPAAERDPAAATWQRLEALHGAGVAESWDWVGTWLDHFGDLVPHRFAVGSRGGVARGIALLTHGVDQYRGPIPVRTIHLGTAGEPDLDTVRVEYNRVLVAPADRTAFAAALLAAIRAGGGRYDEMSLNGFAPEDAAPILAAEPRFRLSRRVSHVTDLRAIRENGGSVLAALRGSTAYKIRRSRRHLEQAHGPLRLEWAETLDQAEDILAELIGLHVTRWERAGQPAKFASTRFRGFHRDLVRRLFPRGGVLLARVTAGDLTVGCDYSLIEHGRVLAYNWGLRRFDDTLISPGLVTGAMVMQEALERGLDEYDWLAGDVLYKRQLSTTTRELIWGALPHGPRGHLIEQLMRARHSARQLGQRAVPAVRGAKSPRGHPRAQPTKPPEGG
jgi:CelD/BcsL family acetyltransferase involved in cellulose biosynthesis